MDLKNFEKPEYFVNRELSWLKFDDRVLSEARDKSLPLFERLKFTSIVSSNLDEFYMVRVASLKDQVHAGYEKTDIAGMGPKEQLKEISVQTHELVRSQYSTLNRSLLPALEKVGLHLVMEHEKLNEEQQEYVDRYFEDNVYPVLTPMAMDSSRPFPLIRNKTLNIGALISKKDKKKGKDVLVFATVQVPSVLPRVVVIPSGDKEDTTVILLEEIIERNIDKLFLGYDVVCAHPYRIMRNADLSIDEDGAEDLLVEIQKQLKKRQWGEVIRLEVEDKTDSRLLGILKKEFDIKEVRIRRIIINELNDVAKKYGQPRRSEILYDLPEEENGAEEEAVPDYPVTVFFTREGYFKKIPPQGLRTAGAHKLKEGDEIVQQIETRNNMEALFFTDKQQVYKVRLAELEDGKVAQMGIFIPGRLAMDEGENVLAMVITGDYSGHMLFFFASGKCAKIPLSSYATKQNRRKLLKAYCDKEPLAKLLFLPEETELAIRTSASRMLLVGSAQIAAKTTRDSQGVAVVTLKKNQTIASVVPADTLELADPHRYRVRSLPATGALIRAEDSGEQMSLL